jgi:cytochrome bd ubiquinol oxidase subunit II
MPWLETIWFVIVGGLLAGYAILDGFDLGAGMLHLFVARDDAERREVFAAIGPVWDGNEVWLLAAGGSLFAAFPRVYATVFSGLYLALMLVLPALVLRAVSIEFRSKVADVRWRSAWDRVFAGSSFIVAFLLGVAIGNVVRGLPLDVEQEFAGTPLDLLNPFALSVGLFSVAMCAAQGAAWLQGKTEGAVRERVLEAGRLAWAAWAAMWVAVTLAARVAAPGTARAWTRWEAWVPAALTVFFLARLRIGWSRDRPATSFLFSSAAVGAIAATLGLVLYPTIVPALGSPERSLTIENAASSPLALRLMLAVAAIGMPLVLGYTVFIYSRFKGTVVVDDHGY